MIDTYRLVITMGRLVRFRPSAQFGLQRIQRKDGVCVLFWTRLRDQRGCVIRHPVFENVSLLDELRCLLVHYSIIAEL